VTFFQYAAARVRHTEVSFYSTRNHQRGEPAMPEYNIWAVLTAAVSGFVLGGLWYSPLLFAKAWQREAGISDEQLKSANMGLVFGLAFVLCLVASFVFATSCS
jgi:hypothetical protein